MHTADQICNMIDFLVDNIFCKVWGVSISLSYWNDYGNELCSIAR